MSQDFQKKKKLEEYSQSKPTQLELFEIDDKNDKYSNTIELYDSMPKYHFGSVRREGGKFLNNLQRKFKYRGRDYSLSITPASLTEKDGSTRHYYPSQREELVEDVIRKVITKKGGVFLDNDAAAKISLYEIQKELKKIGHGYNINEIKQAIEICNQSTIKVRSKDSNEVSISSTIFPFVAMENREMNGRNRVVIMFHPLITKSINQGTYRLINYQQCMQYKMPLSRWLHKRISHLFIQASSSNPYSIKSSTIVRDSGMSEYKKISNTLRQIRNSLDEMREMGSIDRYDEEKIYDKSRKNKIIDAKYFLYMSEDFVLDVKKGNIGIKMIRSGEASEDITSKISERLKSNYFTVSNDELSNIAKKLNVNSDNINLFLGSIEAAREYIEGKIKKKEQFNIGKIISSAVKGKWQPNSLLNINNDGEKKIEKVVLKNDDVADNDHADWVKFKDSLIKSFNDIDVDSIPFVEKLDFISVRDGKKGNIVTLKSQDDSKVKFFMANYAREVNFNGIWKRSSGCKSNVTVIILVDGGGSYLSYNYLSDQLDHFIRS